MPCHAIWPGPCCYAQAVLPHALALESCTLALALELDGMQLPDIFNCSVRKHVNGRSTSSSFRLQGAHVYR